MNQAFQDNSPQNQERFFHRTICYKYQATERGFLNEQRRVK